MYVILTEDEVGEDTGEDVDAQDGQGQDEQVEVAVVPLAHTVTQPRAVVVKPLCNIQGQWWSNRSVTYRGSGGQTAL